MEDTVTKTVEFAQELRSKQNTGEEAKTILSTSDRVLARITDGIYRQPSSALRELISNAYDADATEVTIQTDAPRFEKITIRDNGNGMTYEALSNLIHNIGGSIKRTVVDDSFGIVDADDPTLSPVLKRKIIGKIGIGLFAVSQLTHHFQIITKRKGDNFKLFADVILKTYTEDELTDIKTSENKKPKKFETGTAVVKTIKDPNLDAHGTDIILLKLKKHSRDLLRSRELWERVLADDNQNEEEPAVEPAYHIGKLNLEDGTTIRRNARLPWNKEDSPKERFTKLTHAVIDQVGQNYPNPKLENIFDNYLNTIWTLGLSAPLPYVEKHPFDIDAKDNIRTFTLSNNQKGQATELEFSEKKKVRDLAELEVPLRNAQDTFEVYFDDISLKRPIMFKSLPHTDHAIKTPLLFVGKCSPNLSNIPEDIRGGKLSFEAYLFWNSKIVPVEHQGVLIRIHDASGALFDETFLKYQVSEQTRRQQVTAEIFIKEGLDAALNIDRESFNYAHPHYQFITKWLHRAFRQFSNRHKKIGADIRENKKAEEIEKQKSRAEQIAHDQWKREKKEEEEAPLVEFVAEGKVKEERAKGKRAFSKTKVIPDKVLQTKGPTTGIREQKVQALIKVLDAYGILDEMPYEKQENLIHAITDLFLGDE